MAADLAHGDAGIASVWSHDGLALNGDVPHPSFPWRVDLPNGWTVVETRGNTGANADGRLVRERDAGVPSNADVDEFDAQLAELAEAAKRSGVLICLARELSLGDGSTATAGINIAWFNSAPASLSTARAALRNRGITEEHDGAGGPFLFHEERVTMPASGGGRSALLTSIQAYVPVPVLLGLL